MTMFTKPFRVKSNTQMKGSDKKKLKAAVKKCFPTLSDEDLNVLLPMKEEIVVNKIFTFSEESVLVYIHKKNAVFIELEKEKLFIPTVYTLWKLPEILPTVTTSPGVMPRIANGADLMLPGVIINEEKGIKAYCDGKLSKGDLVAINLHSNKAPVAVGTAWLSSEDMYMAAKKGKCVNIKHFYGDQLWAAGTRDQLPDLGPTELESSKFEEGSEGEDEEEEEEGAGPGASKNDVEINDECDVETVIELAESLSIPEEDPVVDERSPQEIMDEMLENSLLQCLKTTFSQKKSEFPILTSNLFRVHMVTASPPGSTLDIKKSSYKKLSKYLSQKENEGLLQIKELTKGVESVVSVNYEHELLRQYRVVKYEKIEEPETERDDETCEVKYEPPVIEELVTVTANVLKLFKFAEISKGSALTARDVRKVMTNYVKTNSLTSDNGPGLVKLDTLLSEICSGKTEVKWEELQQAIMNKMSPGYSLQFGDKPPIVFKGKLDCIELSVATRSGNKKVTLINNLDTYQINPEEFAHQCQVYLSVGTSYHPAPNRKSGTEVLIQGNHMSYAAKLLQNFYKIPKKYVKVFEVKSKKK